MRVYIAGPYSAGDVAVNVRIAVKFAEILIAEGHMPYVPHLTHLWHLISPHEHAYWMKLDKQWLMACDVVVRLPGESAGAEEEVALATKQGKRVFWLDEWRMYWDPDIDYSALYKESM